ncbi:MAG: 1-acyl-sn-glycerol-3-phosphate acyltransferase [Paracoccaceae bacterium]|nr:1-acyl-sn-glycerol-3-phosphate acyltransferase [Paracoccaceae bacterium]
MFQTVTLPLWLFVLILVFAGVTFASHFLFPSVRWFFRRRMEKVVARLNQRLDQPIQPFKLMRRHDMIIRLVHDPKVAEAVAAEAQETGEPQSVVFERARRYAREIVPAFSASVYFGFAARIAKWIGRKLYRVRIGHFEAEAIGAIDRGATIVFVMNHRSNMDYMLVTHLASRRSALSYAVGEWARVWPLSWLIRSSGAYFIRRKSGNPLYRRVLSRYVQMATEEGVAQAIFPEGGLSLDGRVGAARLGILSYIVSGYRPGGRDVVFIPVALNYDRVLEDRVLVAAQLAGKRRFRAPLGKVISVGARHLWQMLRGRFRQFGTAAVSFGTPLSLASFLADAGPDPTGELATALMKRITQNVPVLPVPLTAAALREGEAADLDALVARAEVLAGRLNAAGAHLNLPQGSVRAAVEIGVAQLIERQMAMQQAARIIPAPDQMAIMEFYAAPTLQLLDAVAASAPEKIAPKSPDRRSKRHKITKQ